MALKCLINIEIRPTSSKKIVPKNEVEEMSSDVTSSTVNLFRKDSSVESKHKEDVDHCDQCAADNVNSLNQNATVSSVDWFEKDSLNNGKTMTHLA
jgi:hypothetical protein